MSLKNAKVLIINAGFHCPPMANGRLNETLALEAEKYFQQKGHETKITHMEKGYKIDEEVAKLDWADVIFFQTPTWWLGLPNPAKKYIDEVLNAYMGIQNKKAGKKFMISATFGALEETLYDKNSCYEGKGPEAIWFPLYVGFKYIGIDKLPMVSFYNAFAQDFSIDNQVKRLHVHLDKVFV